MALPRTESRHPMSSGLHALKDDEILSRVFAAQNAALTVVHSAIPALAKVASAATASLQRGGKMGYAGAGSSGLMALADCLELPGTFGISPDRVPMLFAGGVDALLHMRGSVEDDRAAAVKDVHRAGLSHGDTVLCLAASGATPYTMMVAEECRRLGVTVAGIVNVPDAPLLDLSDIKVVLDTGPEVVTGSTRMNAGTAQKLALNMVSVLIGVRLGHVHDGFMVNLVADNAKLAKRAARIVAEIAQVETGPAERALGSSQGHVKAAVLIAAHGVSLEEAEKALSSSAGHLAPLLKS